MAFYKYKKGNTIAIVILIAAVTSLGAFAYLQLSTTNAYVATKTIEPGTKITKEMLSDGTLKLTQVPRHMLSKELTNDYLVKGFDTVEDKFLKEGLKPGKLLFLYDVASNKDTRNNEILKEQNLEAININFDSNLGSPSNVNRGDRVNLYGVYTYDLTSMPGNNGSGVPVSSLSSELKDVFIKNGYSESSIIKGQNFTVSKLLLQNVPIVDVDKEKDTDKVLGVTVGIDPNQTEAVLLTMKTGKIGFSLLPYQAGDYNTKQTKGSVSTGELINKGTIGDLKVSGGEQK